MVLGTVLDLGWSRAVVAAAAEAGLEGVGGAVEAAGTLDHLVGALAEVTGGTVPLSGLSAVAPGALAKVGASVGALNNGKVLGGVEGGSTGREGGWGAGAGGWGSSAGGGSGSRGGGWGRGGGWAGSRGSGGLSRGPASQKKDQNQREEKGEAPSEEGAVSQHVVKQEMGIEFGRYGAMGGPDTQWSGGKGKEEGVE